jgi:anti-sigma factor ChrR (cupin superfamily)
MQELAGQLLDAIPPASPQPSTRERLLARVAQTPTRSDQRVGYRQEESWKSTGLPGISIRSLSIDRDLGREMFLLRMEPGAVLPDHRHSQAEECFVLSGTIQTRGLTLSAGDFLRLEAGSQHGDSVTPAGCVVLISAGLAEEVH